jgi:hypothetical protein
MPTQAPTNPNGVAAKSQTPATVPSGPVEASRAAPAEMASADADAVVDDSKEELAGGSAGGDQTLEEIMLAVQQLEEQGRLVEASALMVEQMRLQSERGIVPQVGQPGQ